MESSIIALREASNLTYLFQTEILDLDVQMIAHQCNCSSIFGAGKGLYRAISDKFPEAHVYKNRSIPSKPGTIEVRNVADKRWVCAMYAQFYPGKPDGLLPAPFSNQFDDDYHRKRWFQGCLEKISKLKNLREIAFPQGIGCGLAKGMWEDYHQMLSQFAIDNPKIKVMVVSRDCDQLPVFLSWLRTVEESSVEIEGDELFSLDANADSREELIEDPTEGPLSDPPLTYSDMTLLNFVSLYSFGEWNHFFEEQLEDSGSLPEISDFLAKEESKGVEIFPPLPQIFAALGMVGPEDVKVVIIGQDPYHGPGQATGISFSVNQGVHVPPSLINIFTELKSSGFTVEDPTNGDLTPWCERGVLMVNTAFTVEKGKANSHAKRWTETFTPALFRWMDEHCNPMVLICWGNHAKTFSKYFGDRHKKIFSVHPSPLSAHGGFFGSDPFGKANKLLKSMKRGEIDWSL